MKHLKPDKINHEDDNLYVAFIGDKDYPTSGELAHKVADDITAAIEANEAEWSGAASHRLEIIFTHPDLSDEQKLLAAYEIGRAEGAQLGSEEVCKSCIVGPASAILHKFSKNFRGG